MSDPQTPLPVKLVRATDHIDDHDSVVKSGVLLADAVLAALEGGAAQVEVSFAGLKGASSSYYNVFLRRVEEGVGLAEINQSIRLTFGTRVQQMVFDRSYAAMRKGPHQGTAAVSSGEAPSQQGSATDTPPAGLLTRLKLRFGGGRKQPQD